MTFAELSDIRKEGKKPKDAIVLAPPGHYYKNPTITLGFDDDYRSLHGLDVILMYEDRNTMLNLIGKLAEVKPNYLEARNEKAMKNMVVVMGGVNLWNS